MLMNFAVLCLYAVALHCVKRQTYTLRRMEHLSLIEELPLLKGHDQWKMSINGTLCFMNIKGAA